MRSHWRSPRLASVFPDRHRSLAWTCASFLLVLVLAAVRPVAVGLGEETAVALRRVGHFIERPDSQCQVKMCKLATTSIELATGALQLLHRFGLFGDSLARSGAPRSFTRRSCLLGAPNSCSGVPPRAKFYKSRFKSKHISPIRCHSSARHRALLGDQASGAGLVGSLMIPVSVLHRLDHQVQRLHR